jgi:hypothetical protein
MSCPTYGKVLAELRYKQVIVTRHFASFVPDNTWLGVYTRNLVGIKL